MLRQILSRLSLFCLSLCLIVSCSTRPIPTSSPSAELKSGEGRIAIGTTSRIRTLDPADAYEIFPGILLNNLSDRLYTYASESTELEPQLATALPRVSPDGLTYTIPLRQGVVFHDGTPFNAKAMAFSLNRLIQNGGQPAFLFSEKIASIQAPEEYELVIRLREPFAAFPSLLTFFGACAVSPQVYELGTGKFKPETLVGTGPYRLAAYGPDSLRLEVFDRYWGKKPQNRGIDIQLLSSPANLYNSFRTGGVDVAYQNLEPEQVQQLKQDAKREGWQVVETQGSAVTLWALNVRQKPLDNPLVRQAIAAVVNRPLINDRVFQGQAAPLYSLIPDNFAASRPVFKDQFGENNPALAQKLLIQAGYSATHPLKVQVWYPANSTVRGLIAGVLKALVQEQLGGILQLELKSVDSATANQNLDQGVYPSFLLSWYPDFYDVDTYIQPFLHCARGSEKLGCQSGASQSQGSFYYNLQVNKQVTAQRQTHDPEARRKILAELQQALVKDVPYIPLLQNKEYAFARQRVEGVRVSPTQQFPFWTIRKS
ncbi:peptide ABC transporter substrate-binding protein [Leptolyngbya sp. 'hensonii']|uniref:ABC transporter substrate-binding protein n=1 Tax=Leptolyngbya sp. 'hensonii' TaxID=1922337 RepID=UPI00094F7330|nr:ABC transporter substrate-binding protein [Leptolyngbya sp. 'hensonii']OLP16587.1 peptide ABC transporter substrate-binding protein [Leptolyngbya sp. 'hensonii']